ncbi:hypothetical protein PMT22_02540 [Bifidobacterium longum]|uniref:hypothetical protein n=1 Tax=Bifidobacterium longum TaxID=216816 RepID=UPI001E58275A|nr:hypothetical protein [Bifidobacterium longum]MDB6574840.1 hypothetical protein [Bifidobacterium longum]MDB6886390.1 hypothetical protein [Bifidobacterium longum]MDB6892535.1 hypothetical protein [Bifidobacterium longum]
MATNLLVTGSHGGDDPHVESKHDALMHAAMLGRGGYILKTRNWTMKPTAKDANNITIPAWDLVVEGRQIYIAAPTDVNIQSGSQGQKRRDLIVARYALNSGTGVETVTLEAIKGKPSAATPADPGIETGSIIGGAIVSDLPLCRVNLDGITITSIDTLVNVLQPLEDVWDSLTQTEVLTLINSTYGTVKGYRRGSLVTLRIDWKSSASGSWNTGNFGTLPESWRPPMDLNFSYGGRDGANQKSINVNANGTMTYTNQGGTQGTNAFGMTVSYAL